MADMSKQSDAQLRALMAKDSGADAKTVRAAYSELERRGQKPAFAVTLVLGGRPLEHPKAPPPRPKRKKMAKGGYANCGASMKPTQKSTQSMGK
jgi:hypothetical protein